MKRSAPRPLPEEERERIQRLVRESGERAALELLELCPVTLARAAAGFPIARVTASHIRAQLARAAH